MALSSLRIPPLGSDCESPFESLCAEPFGNLEQTPTCIGEHYGREGSGICAPETCKTLYLQLGLVSHGVSFQYL